MRRSPHWRNELLDSDWIEVVPTIKRKVAEAVLNDAAFLNLIAVVLETAGAELTGVYRIEFDIASARARVVHKEPLLEEELEKHDHGEGD